MDIILTLIAIVGGGAGIISTFVIVFYLFWTLGYKIFRKVKYGISLYD